MKDFELTGIFHVSMELWYQDSTISTRMISLSNLLKLNGKNNQKTLSLKGSCSVNTSLSTPDHQERMTMCLSRPCPAGSSPLWLFISHWGPGSGSSSSCLQSRALPGWWCCRNQTWCGVGQWPPAAQTAGQCPPLVVKQEGKNQQSECGLLYCGLLGV